MATGDFNGDGKQDLAVTNTTDNTVSILFGRGDGTFQPAVAYKVGGSPSGVTVGDFTGDGKPDLAIAIVMFVVRQRAAEQGQWHIRPPGHLSRRQQPDRHRRRGLRAAMGASISPRRTSPAGR